MGISNMTWTEWKCH